MSKFEKLKKICKKVWNLIIPIIIISVIIGAILTVPKYYNKGGGAIETAKLTVPTSHNWEILAASIAGGLFFAILILVIVLNSRRKGSKSAVGAGRLKMSYGKIWNWIIPIVIISAIIGAIFIVPYYKKEWKEKTIAKSAVTIWEKEPAQLGLSPEIRKSDPMQTVITRDDGGIFNFQVYYTQKGREEFAVFEGESEGEKVSPGSRIKGTWNQARPEDGGEWYLERDETNDRLFIGKILGRSGEWIPMRLKIKKD